MSKALGKELSNNFTRSPNLDVHTNVVTGPTVAVIPVRASLEEIVAPTAKNVVVPASAAQFVRLFSSQQLVAAADRTDEVTPVSALNVIPEAASDDDIAARGQTKK